MLSCYSHVWLFATPWTVAPQALWHWILQARILEWGAIPSSRGSSQPRDQTHMSYVSPTLAGRFFTTSITWQTGTSIQFSSVAQLCLILCDPVNCSPWGSSVHGDSPGKNTGVGCHTLLQGIFPTQGSNPGFPHCTWILYHLRHQSGKNGCNVTRRFSSLNKTAMCRMF